MGRPKTRINRICIECKKQFEIIPSELLQGACKYCTYKCRRLYESKHKKTRKEIWAKYNQSEKGKLKSREWHQIKANGQDILTSKSRCISCESKDDLVTHHKDGNNGRHGKSLNNKKMNLLILCRRCHPKFHSRWGLKEVVPYGV